MMDEDLAARADALRGAGESFAVATVVRTVDATAAKPGAKALIRADGAIDLGWIGGGCARAAIGRAARDAVADGRPRLVSLRPEDLLEAEGAVAEEERDGRRFARNGCPSRGSMDVFVEPVIPRPRLVILGESPVAEALVALSRSFDFSIARAADRERDAAARATYVVVATQGAGDLAALRAALACPAAHRAFVGSRRKYAALRETLRAQGADAAALDAVSAPAGLNIAAITPEEIALSILAEITRHRRAPERDSVE